MRHRLFVATWGQLTGYLGPVFWVTVFLVSFISWIVWSVSEPARAASVPASITYQGKLLQNSAAVSTTKQMAFLLYSASSGGTLLYTASGTLPTTSTVNITPSNGIFSVDLGATGTNALDTSIFRDYSAVYLEVVVNGEVLSPRKPITAAPYALNSQFLLGMTATTTSNTTYIPHSDSNGNFRFTGNAQSSAVGGGIIYINPTSTDSDETLFGIAVNGSERFKVDTDGDVFVSSSLAVTSTLTVRSTSTLVNTVITGRLGINTSTPNYNLSVSGTSYFNGTSTFVGGGGSLLQGRATSPVLLSSLATGAGPTNFVIQGHYAYIGHFTGDNLLIVDISDPRNLRQVGSISVGDPEDIRVAGNYAYVISDDITRLMVIDVSNPASPRLVATTSQGISSQPVAMDMAGYYVYVAEANGGLRIFDVSDPKSPRYVTGTTSGLSDPRSVKIVGSYAYVTSDINDALVIFDISNPFIPINIGSITSSTAPFMDSPREVTVLGKYAYVVGLGSSSGLEIIDISDPTNPTRAGGIQNGTGGAQLVNSISVAVSGDYAYIGDRISNVITVIDISSSTNPTFAGSGSVTGPGNVRVQGNYLYTTSPVANFFRVLDITGSRISNTEIGTARVDNLSVFANSLFDQSLTVRGGLSVGAPGFLLDGDFGMTAPTSSLVATNTVRFSHTALFQTSVTSSDAQAFVFDTINSLSSGNLITVRRAGADRFVINQDGFVGINSSTPQSALAVTGSSTILGNVFVGAGSEQITTSSFVLNGNDLYVHDLLGVGNSLYVENSIFIGTSTLSLNGNNTGGTITMTNGPLTIDSTGVLRLNTTNNQNIIFGSGNVGINSTSPQFALSVSGTAAIVGTTTLSGNVGINSSSPGFSLGVVGTTNLVGTTTVSNSNFGINSSSPQYNLTVTGTSYFTGGTTTFASLTNIVGRVYAPRHAGSLADTGGAIRLDGASQVYLNGNYAYVTSNNENAVEIIDISDPSSPAHVGSIADSTILNSAASIFVKGNYAYVMSDRLVIIDISNPTNPRIVGQLVDGNPPYFSTPTQVTVSGIYAYVTAFVDDSLDIIDVSDPYNPMYVGHILNGDGGALLDGAFSVSISGHYAYVVSQGSDALTIIDIANPRQPVTVGTLSDGGAGTPYLSDPAGVLVLGNYAYVAANGDNAIEIINISNPTAPTHAGGIQDATLLDGPRVAFPSGSYLYVTNEMTVGADTGRLTVVDISSSTNPRIVSSIADGGTNIAPHLGNAQGLFVAGNYAYIASFLDDDFEVIDISGVQISNTKIGNASIDVLQVGHSSFFGGDLYIKGGLSVGNTGLLLQGDFGMSVPTSTLVATNTLRFSHTAFFLSTASSSNNFAYIFNTRTAWASSTSKYLLSVRNGGVPLFSVATNGDVHASGTLYARNATVGSPGAPGDVAERVDIASDDVAEPGDVVVVDDRTPDTYRRSSSAYASHVAGVISTNPTIVVGNGQTEYSALMALVGRVPVKVSGEGGAIMHGDLLVSANRRGYAMKYRHSQYSGDGPVAIIGIALENFSGDVSSTGKIMSLVRTGWLDSETQLLAQTRQELATLAAAVGSSESAQGLTVIENHTNQIVFNGEADLDLHGFSIRNVRGIGGQDSVWTIDEHGRFVTNIKRGDGSTMPLYAVQAEATRVILSGSSALEHGSKRIDFASSTQEIVAAARPITVNITLTAEAAGVYVTEKDVTGFTVRELDSGQSNATFDWVVIAERVVGSGEDQPQSVADESQSIDPGVATSTEPDTSPPVETPPPIDTASSTPVVLEDMVAPPTTSDDNISNP